MAFLENLKHCLMAAVDRLSCDVHAVTRMAVQHAWTGWRACQLAGKHSSTAVRRLSSIYAKRALTCNPHCAEAESAPYARLLVEQELCSCPAWAALRLLLGA